MTKMEEEETNGGENHAAIPTNCHTTSPASMEGGGGARGCGRTGTPLKFDPDRPMSCAGCCEQIFDKYYMRVDGKSWHEKCVCCAACRKPLAESCYSKNYKLYCQEDYKRLQYCSRCMESITGVELVMRVGSNSYHVGCFTCDYCNKQLHSGDHFHFLSENIKEKICCKRCYDIDDVSNPKMTESDSEESVSNNDDVFNDSVHPHPVSSHLHLQQPITSFMHPDYVTGGPLHRHQVSGISIGSNGKQTNSIMTSPTDPKRAKRPRTILTTAQRRKFKASFEISQKPCRKVRETLANETGLTPRVVQVWFQNQRAKIKKIARRQSQGDGGTRKGKRRKDADSDSENEVPSSPGSYTSAPTPHQAQYYTDYQSPGSMQTSPGPTPESSIAAFYSAPPHHRGINHNDVSYEDVDHAHSLTTLGDYMHQAPPPIVTSQEGTPQIEMQRMLHERGGMHPFDHRMTSPEVMQHDDMMCRRHDDVTAHHPDDPLSMGYQSNPEQQEQYHPQRHLEQLNLSLEHPIDNVTSTDVANPIDRLMYMQNNYFRT